ncbi:MAG: PDZ domain-containing protein, partial [Anaerolineaceae bacterium]
GINSMIVSGMAIAVPSATVRAFLESVGGSEPGFLGVQLQSVPLPEAIASCYKLPEASSLMLTNIEPGSPADSAGLLPGDVLLSVGGHPRGLDSTARGLLSMLAGRSLRLALLRGGELCEVEATPAVRR